MKIKMDRVTLKEFSKAIKGDDLIVIHMSKRKKSLIRKMEAQTGVSVSQICSDAVDDYFNLKGVL